MAPVAVPDAEVEELLELELEKSALGSEATGAQAVPIKKVSSF